MWQGLYAYADSHLLVVSTCYNGQCKQMPRFRWSFQPKIAVAHPNLRLIVRSNFRAIVQRAIFYVVESNEPREKVTYYVFQPAMSKKGTVFSSSLDQRIEMLRRLDETHRVEQGACWWAKHNNDMYRTIRSRQGCHPGRVEYGRPG